MHVRYAMYVLYVVVQVYGAESYMQYYPLLLYSVVPLVAATLYGFLARALNDFEEHPTPERKKNMLVIKVSRPCYRIIYLVFIHRSTMP